jgi:hypothetical protein
VIDRFGTETIREVDGNPLDSFSNISIAAGSGCTSAGALDPTWANPAWCEQSESPLACEYRITNPSVALIMFGTNDDRYMDRYEIYARYFHKRLTRYRPDEHLPPRPTSRCG